MAAPRLVGIEAEQVDVAISVETRVVGEPYFGEAMCGEVSLEAIECACKVTKRSIRQLQDKDIVAHLLRVPLRTSLFLSANQIVDSLLGPERVDLHLAISKAVPEGDFAVFGDLRKLHTDDAPIVSGPDKVRALTPFAQYRVQLRA